MGSLLTKIQIWNMALDHLKEQPLSSTSDTTAFAKYLSRNYDQQRDFLLERYYWKFAMERAQLAADATAPAFDWQYRYPIPADNLRIVPPTHNGQWNGTPIPYEIENDWIMCNREGPLNVRYVKRITNEGKFSNGFCEVLALRLARRMAHWATGKASMIQAIDNLYREALLDVRQTEAIQVAQDEYYDTDILRDRLT